MKNVLVNYADDGFATYQAINALTGLRCGFDACFRYGPADIDDDFTRRHAKTLNASRGAGYWLWKPYVLARTLDKLDPGDRLFYADAATHFVKPITPLIDMMDRHRLDLLILGEGFIEAQYTKRDAFVLMGADEDRYVCSQQRFASCFMLRKSGWADTFVDRFLGYAEDDRALTDKPNSLGLPDYPDFIAHRHDQSIFSLLSKLEKVPVVAADVIAAGLPKHGGHIINHTRWQHDPRAIIQYLLERSLISFEDLASLQARASVHPGPPS